MKKYISVAMALVLSTKAAVAYCDRGGGDYSDCVKQFATLPVGHEIPPATYSSGGTFILKNAGCVSENARFRFHSAFYGEDMDHVRALAPETNMKQMKMFDEYPRLQMYLINSGAFDKVLPLTILSGEMVHHLTGLPFCQS